MAKHCLCLWLIVLAVCSAQSQSFDLEMADAIEAVKSREPDKREAGVLELLEIREAVSTALRTVVLEANEGTVVPGAKASAFLVMGELGLVQCKSLLEQERGWDWRPDPGERSLAISRNPKRMIALMSDPAESALRSLRLAGDVTLVSDRETTSLADYPLLLRAIREMRSADFEKRYEGERAVIRWYDVVCRSMDSVLRPSRAHVYPDEVKATAAFILGEYRSRYSEMLLWNIDLRDTKGTTNGYRKTLRIETDEPDRPCVVALIKLGLRADIRQCLGRIETRPELSQKTRDRIARVVMKIEPSKVLEIYDQTIGAFETGKRPTGGTSEQRASRLQRLRTVEPIIKGNP